MRTLLDLLPQIERLGKHEAVRWSNGFRTIVSSYADLHATIGAVAARFEQYGIVKGDHVLIWAENQMEWIAVFWACVARGIIAVPVDARFSEALVHRIAAESKPKLIIGQSELNEIANWPRVSGFDRAAITPDDIVEIVYTSGTTGEPKGVVHRHRNICANLRPFQTEINKHKKWARPFQPIRILNLLPLSHMFGQSLGVFIPLLLDASAAFTPETHPGRLIELVRRHRISVIVSVPRILEILRNEVERRFSPSFDGEPASSRGRVLRAARRWWKYRRIHVAFGLKYWCFVVGGARVAPELEEFWGRLGFLVVQGYGLTEASPVVAVNHPFAARRGSLGKVVPGQDVRIAPDGEILVHGESVTNAPDEWLHTGDLGEIDSEGHLYYRGRKKDVVVTPEGLNVYPEDVEAVLNQIPDVQNSAVVGADHVHAVLILKNHDADVAAIVRAANEKLESHQRIKTWSVWPQDDFPRTPSTLKVKRGEIAQVLRAGSAMAEPERDLAAMSSLERVELLAELESKLGRELNEEEFTAIKTRQELQGWLKAEPGQAVPAQHRIRPVWRGLAFVRAFFHYFFAIPLFRNYLPLTVNGLEHLRNLEPPVIFAANHTSHLDTPAIVTALPFRWRQRLAPAMAKEAFRPYFEPNGFPRREVWRTGVGYFLARILFNAYPLPQEMAGTRRALEYTGELVRRGYCPLVYPEGVRTPDGKMRPFRPGIGMMSIRLGVPVVPVHIEGLFDVYSVHDDWPKPGPVRVVFGQPLHFTTESYEEAAKSLQQAVANLDAIGR